MLTSPKSRPQPRGSFSAGSESITDPGRGDAVDGPAIYEEGHEVVLREEEVVVDKQPVPKARIRLETGVTTEEETVSDTVHKEQVDVDGNTDPDRESGLLAKFGVEPEVVRAGLGCGLPAL